MAYRDVILAEASLVNYWELAEPSGTTAADSKGTYTLTYTNATPGSPGIPGGGLSGHFLGAGYKIEGTPTGTLAAPYTLEIWGKTNDGVDLCALFGTRNGGNYAEFRTNNQDNVHQTIDALVGNGSSWMTTATGPIVTTYYNSAWHHFVFTVTSTQVKTYYDGALVGTKTYGSASPKLWDSATKIDIGFGGGSGENWVGYLAQVAAYNTALGAGPILAHYNAGLNLSSDNFAPLLPAM